MKGIVYYIFNLESGTGYVGIHNNHNRPYARFNDHFRDGNYPLSNALNKYGKEAFKVVVLDTGTSFEELLEKEEFWIDRLGTLSPDGYNLLASGSKGTSGWKQPSETRLAHYVARKGVTLKRSLTPEQVKAIRSNPNKSIWEWVSELNVKYAVVFRVRNYMTYPNG
jgi:group I intron endonuclease